MITKLITLLLFAQFTVPMHTGATAATGGGTTPASFDTTAGTTCNTTIPLSLTTYTCNLTNVSTGSMIVIGYYLATNLAVSSVMVDGVAATVIKDQLLAGSFGWQGVYYAANATAGSHTVTLNYATASSSPPAFFVKTIIGAPTSSPIDGTPTGAVFTVGSGVAFACGAFTTTQSNDFVVAWGMTSGATQITAGSGFTLFPGVNLNSGNTGGAFESQVGATVGSYNPGFTNGVGGHQGCIGFAVKHV